MIGARGRTAELHRREFIRVATLAAAAFGVGCRPGETDETDVPGPLPCVAPDPTWGPSTDANVDLPHLGGAPDTPEGRTIAVFCDTVIPGSHRDPTGAPGAIDAGAAALFFDPELPALAFVPLLVAYLDLVANNAHGVPFAHLAAGDRDAVLDTALASLDLLDFAVQLAKLAFFSTAAAGCWLGYPGANAGYVDDPDFSYGVALADELTTDGNLP